MSNDRLPILLEGGALKKEATAEAFEGEPALSREVVLPTKGVWYLWLKATHYSECPPGHNRDAPAPVLIKYSLDGRQPLRGARAEVPVPPYVVSQWLTYTGAKSGFMAQVFVDEPGAHVLGLEIEHGAVTIEKIALTLFHGAAPDGDTLDHSLDPGQGRATFPASPLQVDGFRDDWACPAIQAKGRTYYVDSENGSDASVGTSAGAPWKTFANVSGMIFSPGDAILLKRGGAWEEGLAPQGNGTPDAPISIGAYGEGERPLINGISRPGVSLVAQSHWVIQDLQVTSDVEYGQQGGGISIRAGKEAERPTGILIRNCVAFDSGGHGISVGRTAYQESPGYDGVVIENCLAFANAGAGIEIGGYGPKGGRNSVIRGCTAYANSGMAGIWIHSGENGLIEHCVAYNNRVFQIWTWDSINITMRRCEAFRSMAGYDRGGFDIDWGCQACTVEYCYSHHNQGPGMLLMGSGSGEYAWSPKDSRFNICRYSVFSHDGGIVVIENFEDGKVYNNVVVAHNTDWSVRNQGRTALDVFGWDICEEHGGWPVRNEFVNNIFIGLDGALTLWADEDSAEKGNVFDHNLHWQIGGGGPLIRWGGRLKGTPAEYTDLAELRKDTGQEAHGVHADPQFVGANGSGIGRLPLDEFRLNAGSPARGAGRRVVLSEEWLAARRQFLTETGADSYGIPMDPRPAQEDFWGKALDHVEAAAIGADEG